MTDAAGTPVTAGHDITACYGSRLHCHEHDRDEPAPGFRRCFECGHLFVTAEELLTEHNRQLAQYPELEPETGVAQVFCCPFCLHDW